jgi:hypothetical protein
MNEEYEQRQFWECKQTGGISHFYITDPIYRNGNLYTQYWLNEKHIPDDRRTLTHTINITLKRNGHESGKDINPPNDNGKTN